MIRTLPRSIRVGLARRPPSWVDRFAVPLPEGRHLTLVDPSAHGYLVRLYREGASSYEPATARTWWCLCRRARVIADVGAHVGYYSLLAAAATPHATIHAFEPLAEAVDLLRRNVANNDDADRIRVHGLVLGCEDGESWLRMPEDPTFPVPTASSSISHADRGSKGSPRRVRVARLDSVLDSGEMELDVLKLDVEGDEEAVLAGARRTIERHRPDIVMEVAPGSDSSSSALSWLIERDYRVFDLTAAGPVSTDATDLDRLTNLRVSAEHRYGEVLASTRSDGEMQALRRDVATMGWPGRATS